MKKDFLKTNLVSGLSKADYIDLFDQSYSSIKNFIYYKTSDIDLAEDIAQDTFIKIWEKRASIKQQTAKALLYTIAGNLCKNRYEHQQVVFEFARGYKQNNFSVSPEFEFELKEFNDRLQNAIGSLKEKNRVVFLMNRIDDLTFKQIANNLGLSQKAIEKRMKNALTELKKTIEYKL
ncbi:MAG: sigma-70 family RNA polymerase sigma factor [Draconibacterium sp.]|nr:sigma-70 family RNA polymerase sigma factor [Draconibacterium sp.]